MIIFAKYGEYDRRELLEECLTKYLETMKKTKLEGELTELKNHNDKPYFKDYPDVRFSISHSGALVVVAMAQTEVGIDIEEFRPRAYQKVVENVFTKGEAKEVKDLETFLAVWTRISNSRARGFRASGQTTCRAICFTRASASSQRRSTFSRDTSARSLRKTSPLFSSISIDLSKKI